MRLILQLVQMFNIFNRLFFLPLLFSLMLIWFVVFWLGRLFFVFFNVSPIISKELLSVFGNTIRIDVSAIAYLLLIPLMLSFAQKIMYSKYWQLFFRCYFFVITLYVILLEAVNVCLYQEWGAKINARIFLYLAHPTEILNSASIQHYFVFVLIVIACVSIVVYLYRKLHIEQRFSAKGEMMYLLLPLCLCLIFIGLRGGIQQIPMQESDSYFSKQQKINDVTVNTFWNFNASIIRAWVNKTSNPYHYFASNELAQYGPAFSNKGLPYNAAPILNSAKPNIVFIILEGWSADMVGCVSGDTCHSASPVFDSLSKSGVLFTQCYASGDRSDQGITTVLTSFPALPFGSIINETPKIKSLPCISTSLKTKGYKSLFLFGGDLSYGNLKGLIYQKQFDEIIEEKDIDAKLYRGRLGVHDEHTFELFRKKINTFSSPFFASIFTQSTHFHYDYPHQRNTITWAGEHNIYANAMLYSDSCIGDFFKKAKKERWYNNTLFVLVPDHSHHSPNNWNPKTADYHHIPLLFYGNVLNDSIKGTKVKHAVSQCDVAGTIAQLVCGSSKEFEWSNNLFYPLSDRAVYFVYTEGVGAVKQQECKLSFDAKNNRLESSTIGANCDSIPMLLSAKAYLQYVYSRYLQY